jgi:hypothetical protein
MRAQERTLEANSGWVMVSCPRSHSVIYNINTHIYMNISIMCLRITYCVCICMYTGTCMYLWCAPPPPHVPARGHPQAANMYMHPGGHPPQRAYAIRGHKSARSSAHRLRYTCTQERTPSTEEHVLGTPYAPVRTPPQLAYIYMHPRGHPPGEHMPYTSARAPARANSGWGVVSCSRLYNIIYKINNYACTIYPTSDTISTIQ